MGGLWDGYLLEAGEVLTFHFFHGSIFSFLDVFMTFCFSSSFSFKVPLSFSSV